MTLFHSINGQTEVDTIKARKLTYNDFMKNHVIDDSSRVIVNIFFDKKNNSAKGQMSFFPITAAMYPLFPVISVATSAVSFPFFINGSYLLIKYRKKRLLKVLKEYEANGNIPSGLRRKVRKQLAYHAETMQ